MLCFLFVKHTLTFKHFILIWFWDYSKEHLMLLELWLSLSKMFWRTKARYCSLEESHSLGFCWVLPHTLALIQESMLNTEGGFVLISIASWFLLEAFPKLTYTCISQCLYLFFEKKYTGKTFISLYPEHVFTHLNTAFQWWWFWHLHLLSKSVRYYWFISTETLS